MAKDKHSNLHKAKQEKNDEHYTRLCDIESELSHYRHHFVGKTVFCNCDDPTSSNFWRYFHVNFADLGLKKLIATHYERDGSSSYMMEYVGGNDLDMSVGNVVSLTSNGDFRSDECIELLKQADIVVTNPPFSLFREYIELLMKYEKAFVIIGNENAITYRDFFVLLRDDKVWKGFNHVKEFMQPDGSAKKFGNICWFTNLDIARRYVLLFDPESVHAQYVGNELAYRKYANFDAINVGKTKDIPEDYYDMMGVPISFLDKHNPDEFEIIGLGIANLGLSIGVKPYEPVHKEYRKTVQKRGAVDGDLYMLDKDGHPDVPYARVIIRRKK